MAASFISGYAPVNGISMYYEVHGEGEIPLVLIHGGGSTIETSFSRLLPLFAANRKVIAVELQAHGRTSDRNTPESFDQDGDDAAGLLKYLGIPKADILGFSNGGSTALKMGIRLPEIVNKIVAISGAYRRDGFIEGFFGGFDHATLDHMPIALREAFLKVTPDKDKLQTMFEKDVERMKNFTDWPEEELRSIKAPTLIISSHRDVVPPAHSIKMADVIQGARAAIMPGIHGECIGELGVSKPGSKMPAITAALIENFLNEG